MRWRKIVDISVTCGRHRSQSSSCMKQQKIWKEVSPNAVSALRDREKPRSSCKLCKLEVYFEVSRLLHSSM